MTVEGLEGRHAGERVWVLGNGPSLRGMDLTPLAGEVTMTCNNGHRLAGHIGAPATVWCVEDPLDWEQFRHQWAREIDRETACLVAADLVADVPGWGYMSVPFHRVPFGVDVGPQFSTEPPFAWGATVSYMMLQVAAYMGAGEVVLLGQDFSYSTEGLTERGHVWTVDGPDGNHFDPGYWPQGSRAFRADPPLMHRAFRRAQEWAEASGTRILNATPGTKLDVFPAVDYAGMVGAGAA